MLFPLHTYKETNEKKKKKIKFIDIYLLKRNEIKIILHLKFSLKKKKKEKKTWYGGLGQLELSNLYFESYLGVGF